MIDQKFGIRQKVKVAKTGTVVKIISVMKQLGTNLYFVRSEKFLAIGEWFREEELEEIKEGD
jgi:hypothetical protein